MTSATTATKPDPLRLDFGDRATTALLAAWLLAFGASLAVLFIGEVMGQTPCTLCWYQRIAMLPLALILGVAAWRGDLGIWPYAMPIAGGGVLLAGFHSLVYYGVIPEAIAQCGAGPSCTDVEMTIFGIAIPVLSLAAFAALVVLLAAVRKGAAK